jgi:hypothetical protein
LKDQDDILNWLRQSKSPSFDTQDETFKMIDQMLPVKIDQTPETRSRDIENALDWMRHNEVSPFVEDSPDNFDKLGSLPFARRSPEDRLRDEDNILNWLRQSKSSSFDTPDGTFKKIDQVLPVKKDQTPQSRSRDIENALDWMRHNEFSPSFDDSPDKFEKLGSVPISRRSPEDRLKDQDDVLNWLRQSKSPSFDTPDGTFKKIDQMLPVKKDQTPENRSCDIENALDWMRHNEVSSSFEASPDNFEKLSSLPFSGRSPEELYSDDVNVVIDWLRSGKQSRFDPDGKFSKVDVLLPQKKGVPRLERARDIATSIAWIRNNSNTPFTEFQLYPRKKINICFQIN